jgi:hypothetical protein
VRTFRLQKFKCWGIRYPSRTITVFNIDKYFMAHELTPVLNRRSTLFEERREWELKSHASQESLSLRKRVCCRGSWHASLGEGLACTPRRNSSTFFIIPYNCYSEVVQQLRLVYNKKKRHKNRGATYVPVGTISKGFSAEKIVQLCTVQNNNILAHFPRQF